MLRGPWTSRAVLHGPQRPLSQAPAAQQAPCRGHHEGAALAVSMGQSLLEMGEEGRPVGGAAAGIVYRISVTGPPSGES